MIEVVDQFNVAPLFPERQKYLLGLRHMGSLFTSMAKKKLEMLFDLLEGI